MTDTSPEALAALCDELTQIKKEFQHEAELGRVRILNVQRADTVATAANAIEALAEEKAVVMADRERAEEMLENALTDRDEARANEQQALNGIARLRDEATSYADERDRLAADVARLKTGIQELRDIIHAHNRNPMYNTARLAWRERLDRLLAGDKPRRDDPDDHQQPATAPERKP